MIEWVFAPFVLVSAINFALMRRLPAAGSPDSVTILIPARNEADNLRRLLPQLSGQVFVFDDASTDGTGDIARSLGATVITSREPLPPGWTGKNRACHELGKAAAEASAADWWLFIDADVEVGPEFIARFGTALRAVPKKTGVVTGIPRILPGEGIEPLFMAWVGWIILATNPFGLVSRSGMSHNRFLNGQISAWRPTVYTRLWPNEAVRSQIMEDVMMGRLLARENVPVETFLFGRHFSVRMYRTWRETFDGFSKNSYEITNSAAGTFALAALLLVLAVCSVLSPLGYGLLTLSAILVTLSAGRFSFFAFLMPLALPIGAATLLRSYQWRRTGKIRWKGREYPGS